MKRLIAFILTMAISCASFAFSDVLAVDNGFKSTSKVNTRSIDVIPEGITPLEFETEEEFMDFLDSFEEVDVHFDVNLTTGDVEVTNNKIGESYTYNEKMSDLERAQKSGYHSTYIRYGAGYNVNLSTNYTYENKFGGIGPTHPKDDYFTSAYPTVFLTGLTYGNRIGRNSTNSTISSDRRSIYSFSNGVVEVFTTIGGIGNLAEIEYRISHNVYK